MILMAEPMSIMASADWSLTSTLMAFQNDWVHNHHVLSLLEMCRVSVVADSISLFTMVAPSWLFIHAID